LAERRSPSHETGAELHINAAVQPEPRPRGDRLQRIVGRLLKRRIQ
jgi:hypothetical protein